MDAIKVKVREDNRKTVYEEHRKTTEELLEDRGKQYGSFKKQVVAIISILNILKDIRNQHKPMSESIECEDVENMFLVLKLVRLQTADDMDSIDDLIGYATLIKKNRFEDAR